MRILDRMVLSTFLKLFLIFLLATPPLFILGELVEDVDQYIDAGLGVVQVAHGYIYKLPQIFTFSFPVAALIATVFTVYGMTVHREVVATKAGGISFHRLVAPILVAGVVLTGVALALTEVAPRSMRVALAILGDEDRGRDWRSNFVYQTEGGMTLSAQRLTVSDGMLRTVLLQRRGMNGEPSLWMEATSAAWDPDSGWILVDGRIRHVYGPQDITSMKFERVRVKELTETPRELLQDEPEEEEMTYAELKRMAEIIERSGGEPNKLRVRMEQKFSIPAATLVIILFGAPLATTSRRGGPAYGVGIALGTTILYIALTKVAGGFGSSGAIPALWAAWLPNGAFFLAGLVLMGRVRT